MSSKRIRELLAELERELHTTPDIDEETRELLRDLDDDLERLTSEESTALHRAKELESRFAARHPVAERIARELADIIAKMGV